MNRDVSVAYRELGAFRQMLDMLVEDFDWFHVRASELEALLEGVEATDGVEVARILQALENSAGAADLILRIAAVETSQTISEESVSDLLQVFDPAEGPTCGTPRLVAGRTEIAATEWQQYQETTGGMFVDVDISAHDFEETPLFFTSLGGTGGHWSANGVTSVYRPTADGFAVYVQWNTNSSTSIVPYANERDWHVNWVAVGC